MLYQRTDSAVVKRERTKRERMFQKYYTKKLKLDQHEPL